MSNHGDDNSTILTKHQYMTLLAIIFIPKIFLIFQTFAIPQGGAEYTHFSILNIWPKMIILTTQTVFHEYLDTI